MAVTSKHQSPSQQRKVAEAMTAKCLCDRRKSRLEPFTLFIHIHKALGEHMLKRPLAVKYTVHVAYLQFLRKEPVVLYILPTCTSKILSKGDVSFPPIYHLHLSEYHWLNCIYTRTLNSKKNAVNHGKTNDTKSIRRTAIASRTSAPLMLSHV